MEETGVLGEKPLTLLKVADLDCCDLCGIFCYSFYYIAFSIIVLAMYMKSLYIGIYVESISNYTLMALEQQFVASSIRRELLESCS
jgi:hypothetical protein